MTGDKVVETDYEGTRGLCEVRILHVQFSSSDVFSTQTYSPHDGTKEGFPAVLYVVEPMPLLKLLYWPVDAKESASHTDHLQAN